MIEAERAMKRCHFCGSELDMEGRVGRRDQCPFCGRDLHICLNCRFYDPGAYNQCHEPQAERVVDKERSNFCDYFSFREAGAPDDRKGHKNARDTLEKLFKK